MRLIDYFAIAGYDIEQDSECFLFVLFKDSLNNFFHLFLVIGSNKKRGRIIQRFPEDDLDDCEFDHNIQCFCQPHGWKIYSKQEPPTFFVSILTDVRAQRRYCACLTFLEPLQHNTNKISQFISHGNNNNTGTIISKSNSNFNTNAIAGASSANAIHQASLDDSMNFMNSDEYEDSDYLNENILFESNNNGE